MGDTPARIPKFYMTPQENNTSTKHPHSWKEKSYIYTSKWWIGTNTLWQPHIAMENGPFEDVFPIEN